MSQVAIHPIITELQIEMIKAMNEGKDSLPLVVLRQFIEKHSGNPVSQETPA